MHTMKPIAIKDLSENFFEVIGKEWMLVTAGNKDHFNTMTASWGGIGFLWNKPVVYIFIRPERYTFEFIEKSEYFTLSFLGEENRAIHKICGSKYNPQIQISAESETKRSIFRKRDKTKRSKKESAQHSKSRNKSFVMTSVSAL